MQDPHDRCGLRGLSQGPHSVTSENAETLKNMRPYHQRNSLADLGPMRRGEITFDPSARLHG
jgi:hypothetical protein